jgi:hypothetical protein
MKLFGRTGGYYLFWSGFIYLFVGMFNTVVYEFTRAEFIQLAWIAAMIVPLTVKPVARYFNMRLFWEE